MESTNSNREKFTRDLFFDVFVFIILRLLSKFELDEWFGLIGRSLSPMVEQPASVHSGNGPRISILCRAAAITESEFGASRPCSTTNRSKPPGKVIYRIRAE